MPIVEIKGLTYTYQGGTKPSIRDVSLRIEKGEFVILTGPSGCGKTTLCRCFNGLIPHFYNGTLQGTVRVAELDVTQHQIHELALRVGFVFQNPENQLFALSVEKDVAFALENLGMPREEMRKRVEWALETVGAYEFRERAPHELSGGQQQRVAIASVLAMQPDVMVLDEPTSFLDPLAAKRIFEVIAELNRKLGVTVVLVEHRLDLAAQYANHVVIMDGGAVILDGMPRDIFSLDEARLVGVGIPKATRLFQILKEDGINLKDVPISSDEAAAFLRSILVHDRS